ncbi:IPTL-CTERM sorting domain-containing protein [Pseudomonas sp. ODNR1LW]|nr:IPTL-CTERM sorting domain-containing protein [Pseudomonas sp. ODNR1LW]
MLKPFCAMAGALALVVLPGVALAQTTVNSSRASWVLSTGDVATRTSNYNSLTGDNDTYRSYISFAVPASNNAFTSAVIRVHLGGVGSVPSALTVYDVSSDITSAAGTDLFADLGSGTVFGTISGLDTDYQTVDITLNADGLAAVNAARGGEISFGLANTATAGNLAQAYVFALTDSYTLRQLILTPTAVTAPPSTIPTMSEWAMILFGLSLAGGAALYVQRRRMIA